MDTTELNELRAARVQLEGERAALQEQQSPIYDRLRIVDGGKDGANAVLWNERSHQSERDTATKKRSAALAEGGELRDKLKDIERQVGDIVARIRSLSARIQRAEYEGVPLTDLRKAGREIVASIVDVDARLAALSVERDSLESKRETAQEASEAVDVANDELQSARAALDDQQATGFIAGRDVDLTPYTARVAKAEKRFEVASRNATAAIAASPRITELLKANEGERSTLSEERRELLAAWWTNRKRQEEAVYRSRAHGLLDSAITLLALDQRTGNSLGRQLVEGMRDGLRIPLNGTYSEAVNLTHADDVSGDLSRLEAELAAVLQAGTENAALRAGTENAA